MYGERSRKKLAEISAEHPLMEKYDDGENPE